MIRIGILGAAKVAPYAIIQPSRLRDDCAIQAIACRDRSRGEDFAHLHQIPFVEEEYDALINRTDIDLIYNALPPSLHAELSIKAVQSGKPVLCEKPFAMNAGEAKKMVSASKQTGIPIMEAFHYLFHPAFDHAVQMIRQGDIGKIREMQAAFVAPVPFQEGDLRHTLSFGGGSLMDMGCYPVHWSRKIMGCEPDVIRADSVTSLKNIDVTTKAELQFENGAAASIECSMDSNRPFQAKISVWGTSGFLLFENPMFPYEGHHISVTRGNSTKDYQLDVKGKTYDFQLEHALKVAKGEAEPITGGNDAIANMAVIDDIYRRAGLAVR